MSDVIEVDGVKFQRELVKRCLGLKLDGQTLYCFRRDGDTLRIYDVTATKGVTRNDLRRQGQAKGVDAERQRLMAMSNDELLVEMQAVDPVVPTFGAGDDDPEGD